MTKFSKIFKIMMRKRERGIGIERQKWRDKKRISKIMNYKQNNMIFKFNSLKKIYNNQKRKLKHKDNFNKKKMKKHKDIIIDKFNKEI